MKRSLPASGLRSAILRPQDQMSVIQFATTVQVLTPFTNKLSVIDRGLDQSARRLGHRALRSHRPGLGLLGEQGTGRKVLVVISDGDDTAKTSTYARRSKRHCATK